MIARLVVLNIISVGLTAGLKPSDFQARSLGGIKAFYPPHNLASTLLESLFSIMSHTMSFAINYDLPPHRCEPSHTLAEAFDSFVRDSWPISEGLPAA